MTLEAYPGLTPARPGLEPPLSSTRKHPVERKIAILSLCGLIFIYVSVFILVIFILVSVCMASITHLVHALFSGPVHTTPKLPDWGSTKLNGPTGPQMLVSELFIYTLISCSCLNLFYRCVSDRGI